MIAVHYLLVSGPEGLIGGQRVLNRLGFGDLPAFVGQVPDLPDRSNREFAGLFNEVREEKSGRQVGTCPTSHSGQSTPKSVKHRGQMRKVEERSVWS